ncbi:hypothetical protein [Xylocopilactobacillus apis]|uniref:Uncharacterized protein n=1 Tax=Xylocopilactobacillus apis TaxID=2932183 RepID=A0AAU9CW90_9LACO|nr:hypothetical protein [Xylocopilactobacillus apis]BDR55543.1 hypothetical protein KIMC2_01050 [Xylocopilactobacillus apis]
MNSGSFTKKVKTRIKSKQNHIHQNPFEGDWFNEDLNQIDVTDGEEMLDSEWSL